MFLFAVPYLFWKVYLQSQRLGFVCPFIDANLTVVELCQT
jgi:hypothetical protein